MEILFLYERLHHTVRKQLVAMRRLDFGTLEELTREREKVTRKLCENMKEEGITSSIPISIRKKINDITAEILNIDSEIKELLLEELSERALELSHNHHNRD